MPHIRHVRADVLQSAAAPAVRRRSGRPTSSTAFGVVADACAVLTMVHLILRSECLQPPPARRRKVTALYYISSQFAREVYDRGARIPWFDRFVSHPR